MNKIMSRLKERKGFTLAELLIVVAIIAVLVTIAIPIFATQLERSKEATDTANVRSACAEVVTAYLTDGNSHTMTVTAQQGQSGWQNSQNGKIYTQVNGSEASLTIPAHVKGNSYSISITQSGKVSVQ